MKYYCIENGCLLADVTHRPNFCHVCGSPQNSEAKAKKITKTKVTVEEDEDDEEDETVEFSAPKSLFQVEGLSSSRRKLGDIVNQSKVSERSLRPIQSLEKLQSRAKSEKPIDLD